MNLNQRQLQLLNVLLELNNYITADELTKKVKYTSRTIKSDLAILNDELKSYSLSILSKKGSKGGYIIDKRNVDEMKKLKSDLKSKKLNFGGYRSEYNQRAFILSRLIINSNGIFKIDDLIDMTDYSRSIINQEMPEIKRRLSRYNIELKPLPKQGIAICGTEYDIRIAMIDLFEINEDDLSSKYFFSNGNILKFYEVIKLRQNIKDIFLENSIETSTILFDRIVIAFVVTLSRKNNVFEQFNLDVNITNSKMFNVVNEIINKAGYNLEKDDLIFLTYYCLSFSFPKKEEIKHYYAFIYNDCKIIFDDLRKYLLDKFEINCVNNKIVNDALFKIVLQSNIARNISNYSMYFTNEIRDYCRQKQLLTEIAYRCLDYIGHKYNMKISRYQIYQFVLSLDTYFTDNSKLNYCDNIKIKIISNFDIIAANLYCSKLKRFFDFKEVLIVNDYNENDNQSIYIVVDNDYISGDNVINVSYEIDSSNLIKQVITKLYYCKRLNCDYVEKIKIIEDDIIELHRVVSVSELFTLISSLYNTNPKKQFRTYEYIEKRNDVIPYESRKSRICTVPLFNQDINGVTIIKLKKPLIIRNWETDFVFVISLDNNIENMELYLKISNYISLNNQEFISCINNIDNTNYVNKLVRKAMIN